jgi:hypothetical protein
MMCDCGFATSLQQNLFMLCDTWNRREGQRDSISQLDTIALMEGWDKILEERHANRHDGDE